MESQVQYTPEAEKRRARLINEYAQSLEASAVSSKRIPGDREIEITASDLDEAAKRFNRLQHRSPRERIIVMRIWIALGLLVAAFGLFYDKIYYFAQEQPIQLIISFIGLTLAICGWALLEYPNENLSSMNGGEVVWFEEHARRLRTEIQGRIVASLGYMMGEFSLDPNGNPVNQMRLEEAIEYCWEGYHKLEGLGPAEFMALNNLVFFLSVRGDKEDRSFVLEKARELRNSGQEHDAPNLLLTYCRAVTVYGGDLEEIRQVRDIAATIAASPQSKEKMRREAKVILDHPSLV